MISTDILNEAARIVGGKSPTHGPLQHSFELIADYWNCYLQGRKEWAPISPVDVAQMMVLFKIARGQQGTRTREHFVDQAGYSANAGELAAAEARHHQSPLMPAVADQLAKADEADRAPVLAEDEVVASKPAFAWSTPDPLFDPLGR